MVEFPFVSLIDKTKIKKASLLFLISSHLQYPCISIKSLHDRLDGHFKSTRFHPRSLAPIYRIQPIRKARIIRRSQNRREINISQCLLSRRWRKYRLRRQNRGLLEDLVENALDDFLHTLAEYVIALRATYGAQTTNIDA